jgi:hypothetical protein
MSETKNVSKESVTGEAEAYLGYLWIVVACMPLLFQLPSTAVPIWALILVIGGWIAHKHPLRWIALAWLTSIFFPGIPFLLIAGCGVLLKNWRDCMYAAILGSALALMPVPGEFRNIGTIFIIVGLIAIVHKRINLFKGL